MDFKTLGSFFQMVKYTSWMLFVQAQVGSSAGLGSEKLIFKSLFFHGSLQGDFGSGYINTTGCHDCKTEEERML